MSKVINIGGRLHSTEQGNILTGANEILDDTKGKKQNVINSEVDAELLRLEQSKQDNLTFDNAPTENSNNPVKSGGVYAADKALSDAIEAILLLIPSAATVLNKLADIAFVNSSVSTATATFRGTYNVVTDLELAYDATHEQIAAKLGQIIATADNNDYSFVQIPVSATSTNIRRTERYKYNGTAWGFEYDLNTSGFTAAQWEAINSGITALLVLKLSELPTATELATALAGKQATLTFDNAPTSDSDNPVKSGGIYNALSNKQDNLTFDNAPTEDSDNPVKSGGIYTAIKAVADALSDVSDLIPTEATDLNQLADKAYVLAKILDATPAFKGQFVTLAELQAVASPKAGDLGIVRTKNNDGLDVFTFYQYLNNTWNVFFTLQHHPQTKPVTTGTTGDYPYNGMGRVELAMNMVNTAGEGEPEVLVNQLTQDMFYKGEVGSRVANTNTVFVIAYDYVLAENITIPANCVLEFTGGSITRNNNDNYTIDFNLCKIDTESECFDNILLGGRLKDFSLGWIKSKTISSAVIQSIVRYCNNLYVPKGVYDFSAPIEITSDDRTIHIYGDFDHYYRNWAEASDINNVSLFRFANCDGFHISRNIKIDNIRIDVTDPSVSRGTYDVNTHTITGGYYGILANSLTGEITNCTITSFKVGIYAANGGGINTRIFRCYFRGNLYAGIQIDGNTFYWNQAVVEQCHFDSNGNGGYTTDDTNTEVYCGNGIVCNKGNSIIFRNNIFEFNTGVGIYLYANAFPQQIINCAILNNYFECNKYTHIYIYIYTNDALMQLLQIEGNNFNSNFSFVNTLHYTYPLYINSLYNHTLKSALNGNYSIQGINLYTATNRTIVGKLFGYTMPLEVTSSGGIQQRTFIFPVTPGTYKLAIKGKSARADAGVVTQWRLVGDYLEQTVLEVIVPSNNTAEYLSTQTLTVNRTDILVINWSSVTGSTLILDDMYLVKA